MRQLATLAILFAVTSVNATDQNSCRFTLSGYGQASSDFTSNLTGDIAKNSPNENLIVPATAIHSVLTMAMLGTGEKSASRAQLAKALQIPQGLGSEQIVEVYGQALQAIRASGDGVEAPIVRLVNAMFVSPESNITAHYKEAMKNEFDAQVVPATPKDLALVNDVVNKTTDGRLKKVMDSLNPNMRVVLVSASFVKGGWVNPFKISATRPGKFHPTGGQSSSSYNVDMLSNMARHGFVETEGFQVVELAMKGPQVKDGSGPRYSALVIVPKGERTPLDILSMTQSDLNAVLARKTNQAMIRLYTPKFNFEWKGDLIPTLRRMEVKDPFDNADFSNLAENSRNLYISQVKSVGFIDFNETGLAGGGAAAVEVSYRGLGPQADRIVTVDRPFVLVVRDNELQIPLLQAAVYKPNASTTESVESASKVDEHGWGKTRSGSGVNPSGRRWR